VLVAGRPVSHGGTLPPRPFATYVLLTIGGLALLAVGLLADHVAPESRG
jgi:hypothetical protein